MDSVIIREFCHTIEDARQLKEIDQLTFRDCPYNEMEIIEIAKDPRNTIWVAEIDGRIVGFISLLQVQTLHYKGLWVDLIAVVPSYQNMGIAGKLLAYGKKFGEILDVDFVSGLVAANNPGSQKAFKKSGFQPLEKDFHLFIFDRKQEHETKMERI